ncbi:MAG: phage portal protein [Smithella sp.]
MRPSPTHNKPFLEKFKDGVDSVIEIFNPRAAFMRRYARNSSQTLFSGGYSGASKNRLLSNWLPGGGSADADLLDDLPSLRERSRDLERNDGFAAGIIKTYAGNIIASGIRAQSRLKYKRLGITKEQAAAYQDQIEEIFEDFIPHCDANQKLDFYEDQELIIKQQAINGDVVVIPLRVDTPRYKGVTFQVVEADRLGNPQHLPDKADLRDGVEIGPMGEPVAYHIKKTHPGDKVYSGAKYDDYIRYPAYDKFGNRNVFHLYTMERPEQSRGVPLLAPVLSIFLHMNKTIEAAVLKERIAACFAVFITKMDALTGAVGRGQQQTDGTRYESLEPGQLMYGNPGEDMKVATPSNPGGTFDPIITLLLRYISAAINIPYEVVAKDFSKTNYSSNRAALLDAVKMFKSMQKRHAKNFCQPVFEIVLEDAYLQGKIDLPNFYEKKKEWCRIKWQAPGWSWIKPMEEVQAAELALKNHFRSRADIVSELGNDWEETADQIALEEQKEKDLGIFQPILNQAGNAVAGQPANGGQEPKDPEQDPNKNPDIQPEPNNEADGE